MAVGLRRVGVRSMPNAGIHNFSYGAYTSLLCRGEFPVESLYIFFTHAERHTALTGPHAAKA